MKKFQLEALPYAMDALEPHISRQTLEFHYGKHHQTYVNTLNTLIEGTPFATQTLEDIIRNSEGPLFNNAAQVYNHTFYWNCLSPKPTGGPTGKLKETIEAAFGSVEAFKEEFTKKSLGLFGSGWCWLVKDAQGALAIVQKSNAGTPLTEHQTPLLVCDVWEHAYYLDKQNARAKYLESFWALVDWDKVSARF